MPLRSIIKVASSISLVLRYALRIFSIHIQVLLGEKVMKILAAQCNYQLNDFENNTKQILEVLYKYGNQVDLIVFSELCLSGYYPKDLIEKPEFLAEQNTYIEKLKKESISYQASIIIGFVDSNCGSGKSFKNALGVIRDGELVYVYHKHLLPVFNIFDEARHFAPGTTPGIWHYQDYKIGFLICADGWASSKLYQYDIDPVDQYVNQDLDIVICINASPSNIGKQHERHQCFSTIAKRCHAPVLFTNQVGGNDEYVFDGASFLLDHKGSKVGQLKNFQPDIGVFELNQNSVSIHQGFETFNQLSNYDLVYQQISIALKDYLSKCGCNGVIVGVSGGIDSALTLALAVQALGSDKVIAINMPSRYSSKGSVDDSITLCQNLNIRLFHAPIEEQFALALQNFETVFGEKVTSLTEQNIQARLRALILMQYSNQTGYLVLTTGNKSELSVGYSTLYGDMCGAYNLIGDLYKTEVFELSHYYNKLHPNQKIPEAIINKAPSAELYPEQTDQDKLPDYETLDIVLKHYLEKDLLPPRERNLLETKYSEIPTEVVRSIIKMVNQNEFKRQQAPPIVRIHRRAFGLGWQYPISAKYNAYAPIINNELATCKESILLESQ